MTSASLLTTVGLWLSGLGFLAALRPRRRRSALELHATAVMLGLAVLPALVTTVVALAGPLSPAAGRGLLGATAALGLVALLLRRHTAPAGAELAPPPAAEPPSSILERIGLVLLVVFCAFALFAAGSMPVHVFDPVYHFAHKGKLIFHEGFGTPAWTDLEGLVGRVITHPNYPPGIPSLQALVGYVNGAFDEDAARALMGLFVVAPAAWLYATLRGRSRAAAVAAGLLWASLPLLYYSRAPHPELGKAAYGFLLGTVRGAARWPDGLWSIPDGWTIDGAGDLPLAALFFGAFLHLWRALPGSGLARDRADVGIAGCLLGGAMLAKNEGLGLAAVLVVGLVLAQVVRRLAARGVGVADGGPDGLVRGLVPIGAALAIGLALSAAWLAIRGDIPSIDEGYPSLLASGELLERLPRARVVWSLGFYPTFFENVLRWNLLWPTFFAVLAWSLLRPARLVRHPAFAAVLVVLGAFALYFAVLIVSPWFLPQLFSTVIPGRLVLHVTPVAILALAALMWRRPEEVAPAAARADSEEGR